MEAYQAALAGAAAPVLIGAERTKPGTIAAAVAIYFESVPFANLGGSTRQVRRRILERLREEHGDKPIRALEHRHIEHMLVAKIETPHAAKHFLNALRAVIAVAIKARMRTDDPTVGIQNLKATESDGHKTWNEDHIARFEAAHKIGSRARLAFGLLLFTGQRRSDIVRMGRQHVRNGFLYVRQKKTNEPLEIPMIPQLAEIIAATPSDHLTFLTTQAGRPFTAAGFGNWFRDRCNEAGVPADLSAHGLRKAMCVRLAEAGCTVHQIAAISGHKNLKEVALYTKAVDQKRLAAQAMEKMTGTNQDASSGKPSSKVSQFDAQVIERKGK